MPSDAAPDTIRLVVPSTPLAVREALCGLFHSPALRHLPETERGTAEIVLAEVLNNIVEHAYAGSSGEIEVMIRIASGALTCTIVDHGGQLIGQMPPPDRPPARLALADLPEGGFGWHLIRTLTSDLDYRRIGPRNELSFRLIAEQ